MVFLYGIAIQTPVRCLLHHTSRSPKWTSLTAVGLVLASPQPIPSKTRQKTKKKKEIGREVHSLPAPTADLANIGKPSSRSPPLTVRARRPHMGGNSTMMSRFRLFWASARFIARYTRGNPLGMEQKKMIKLFACC